MPQVDIFEKLPKPLVVEQGLPTNVVMVHRLYGSTCPPGRPEFKPRLITSMLDAIDLYKPTFSVALEVEGANEPVIHQLPYVEPASRSRAVAAVTQAFTLPAAIQALRPVDPDGAEPAAAGFSALETDLIRLEACDRFRNSFGKGAGHKKLDAWLKDHAGNKPRELATSFDELSADLPSKSYRLGDDEATAVLPAPSSCNTQAIAQLKDEAKAASLEAYDSPEAVRLRQAVELMPLAHDIATMAVVTQLKQYLKTTKSDALTAEGLLETLGSYGEAVDARYTRNLDLTVKARDYVWGQLLQVQHLFEGMGDGERAQQINPRVYMVNAHLFEPAPALAKEDVVYVAPEKDAHGARVRAPEDVALGPIEEERRFVFDHEWSLDGDPDRRMPFSGHLDFFDFESTIEDGSNAPDITFKHWDKITNVKHHVDVFCVTDRVEGADHEAWLAALARTRRSVVMANVKSDGLSGAATGEPFEKTARQLNKKFGTPRVDRNHQGLEKVALFGPDLAFRGADNSAVVTGPAAYSCGIALASGLSAPSAQPIQCIGMPASVRHQGNLEESFPINLVMEIAGPRRDSMIMNNFKALDQNRSSIFHQALVIRVGTVAKRYLMAEVHRAATDEANAELAAEVNRHLAKLVRSNRHSLLAGAELVLKEMRPLGEHRGKFNVYFDLNVALRPVVAGTIVNLSTSFHTTFEKMD